MKMYTIKMTDGTTLCVMAAGFKACEQEGRHIGVLAFTNESGAIVAAVSVACFQSYLVDEVTQ